MPAEPRTLADSLDTLEAAGLIRRAQPGSAGDYMFRHVLSQEAAYQSLLKQDRRRLHLAVGNSLERMGMPHAESAAPMLAHHFLEAGDDARALRYLTAAAQEAARRFANAEAIMHFDRAIDLSARTQQPLADHAELVLKRGRLLEIRGSYAEALRGYTDLEEIAKADEAVRLKALMALTVVHSAPTSQYDSERGEAYADRVIEVARRLGNRGAEAQALWLHMLRCKFIPDMARALEYGDRSIAISRELGLHETLAYALNDIFPVHLTQGRMDAGMAGLVEAEQLWRALDNQPMLVDTLVNIGLARIFGAEHDRAEQPLREAIQIAQDTGSLWGESYATGMLGQVRAEQCRYGEAISLLESAIERGHEAGFALASIYGGAILSGVYLDLGLIDRGRALAQEGIRKAEESLPGWRGLPSTFLALASARQGDLTEAGRDVEVARRLSAPADLSALHFAQCAAEYHMRKGDYEAVLSEVRTALDGYSRMGIRVFEPREEVYAGEALIRLGRLDEAADTLRHVITTAIARGTRRPLWRAYHLLAGCQRSRGNQVEASSAQDAARAGITFILDHLDRQDHRASFAALPEVRAVLAPNSNATVIG